MSLRYLSALRRLTTTTSTCLSHKPSLVLLARIRKETQTPIALVRKALIQTGNDYDAALAWLDNDALVSGKKKADKVSDRVAKEVTQLMIGLTRRKAICLLFLLPHYLLMYNALQRYFLLGTNYCIIYPIYYPSSPLNQRNGLCIQIPVVPHVISSHSSNCPASSSLHHF